MENLQKIKYLCSMIVMGVKEKDKDCIRSNLEDLNYFLIEKNLLAE